MNSVREQVFLFLFTEKNFIILVQLQNIAWVWL